MKIFKYLIQLNLFKTFVMSCKIKAKTLVYRNVFLNVNKSASINSEMPFIIGKPDVDGNFLETTFFMGQNAKFVNNSGFTFFSGTKIKIYKDGVLEVNGGYINSLSRIHCYNNIKLGKGVIIGENVVIRDSDSHCINNGEKDISKPINIGNHVWIGQDAIILKGVTIGDGVIIGAGAVVTSDVPDNCLACGSPARVIKRNVYWN